MIPLQPGNAEKGENVAAGGREGGGCLWDPAGTPYGY